MNVNSRVQQQIDVGVFNPSHHYALNKDGTSKLQNTSVQKLCLSSFCKPLTGFGYKSSEKKCAYNAIYASECITSASLAGAAQFSGAFCAPAIILSGCFCICCSLQTGNRIYSCCSKSPSTSVNDVITAQPCASNSNARY